MRIAIVDSGINKDHEDLVGTVVKEFNVINSNKTKISTALSKGKPVDIYKTINGIKYKVHIGKDGYVKSAYPV